RRYCYPWSGSQDRYRRWAGSSTSASLAALVTLFFVSDEELCTDDWSDLHDGRTCYCQPVTNFGSVLRVGAGAKINSRSCQHIRASAVFAVARQNHLNHAPICASVLREIRDLHEMIAGHRYFK